MFWRIQPVKNGSAVCDAEVCDFHLRRSCQEFMDALRACAAFNVDSSSASAPEPTNDRRYSEEIAYEKMEHALQELRSLRASCSAGFQAKFEALFALEDWFGKEDFRVIGFAFELAEEAYAFFIADQAAGSEPFSKMRSGSSRERRQFRLSFPRLRRLAGEPRSNTTSRARHSQS